MKNKMILSWYGIKPRSRHFARLIFLLVACIAFHQISFAQRDPLRNMGGRLGGMAGGMGGGGNAAGSDSLVKRVNDEDSLVISFKYLDSTRVYQFDSSINDFSKRYPNRLDHLMLGNIGNAALPLIFQPHMKPGFDPGFHALDLNKLKMEEARFFNTTRPLTELTYLLGSNTEQSIGVLHTQNIRPNWNFSFQYRLIGSNGTFKNQNVSHNNYFINSYFQTKNKRYSNYFAILSNQLRAAENGGILTDQDYLSSTIYNTRTSIPVNITGQERDQFAGPLDNNITAGNFYNNSHILLRQQYDWGQKDSLQVNDSTLVKLYYPRIRIHHQLEYKTHRNRYSDFFARTANSTAFYRENYQLQNTPDTLQLQDQWRELTNELALFSYPDKKNQEQFLKLGAQFQQFNGTLRSTNLQFFNLMLLGEYRNKTKNQKWDLIAYGQLFSAGFHAGDYLVSANLKRLLGKKLGYLELGFQNVNRTPSFIFDQRSSFNFSGIGNWNKENITHAFAQLDIPALKTKLSGHLYLVGNYMFYENFTTPAQASSVFNFVRISADKKFRISKFWNWYAHLSVQQRTGDGPINLPLVFTTQKIAYEGKFFKRLNLSTGLEMRYFTPFQTNGYSPILGQFFVQENRTLSNLPDVAAFFHFRIRTFTTFIRGENLNTLTNSPSLGFFNNNEPVPGYYSPGFLLRIGIFWSFVN